MPAGSLSGQTALCSLPAPPPDVNERQRIEKTLDSVEIPVQLRLTDSGPKNNKGTSSGVLGNGMDVVKVGNGGKRQARRIGITSDKRNIQITTEKSVGYRNTRKKKPSASAGTVGSRKIEICSIDRIVRGQVTRKFLKNKPGESITVNTPVAEENISLSIVFRVATAATSSIVKEEELQTSADSTNSWGSLDLIIPSHNDYEILIRTLNKLIALYHETKSDIHPDILLLQHHWMELDKPLNSHLGEAEWTSIVCDHISVPLSRTNVGSYYRKYLQDSLGRPDIGITLVQSVELLNQTRSKAFGAQKHIDPCEAVWNLVQRQSMHQMPALNKTSGVLSGDGFDLLSPSNSDDSTYDIAEREKSNKTLDPVGNGEHLSAEGFLQFVHTHQKETKTSIVAVRDLFERLNSQALPQNMSDDGTSRQEELKPKSVSRDYVTKSVFCDYLRSDPNDAFDPNRGKWEQDDMSQPLSSYWINASHDTYLKDVPPIQSSKSKDTNHKCDVDVQMYTTALHRGARCLDLDLWDGEGKQYKEPVVRFGTTNHKQPSEDAIKHGKHEGLPFLEVVRAVRSYIRSNPQTLPVIFFIESHCGILCQKKVAKYLKNMLGSDDMLYIPPVEPDDVEDETLPSPEELRGKVVLKCKIPSKSKQGVSALFDDYDDENDIDPFVNDVNEMNYGDEEDIKDAVLGFEAVGSIISESPHRVPVSPDDLVQQATTEAEDAMAAATAAEDRAFKATVKANRAEEFASKILSKIGMTLSEADDQLNLEEEEFQRKMITQDSQNSFDDYDDDDLLGGMIKKHGSKIDKAIDLAVDGVDRTIRNLRKNLRNKKASEYSMERRQSITSGFSGSSEFTEDVRDGALSVIGNDDDDSQMSGGTEGEFTLASIQSEKPRHLFHQTENENGSNEEEEGIEIQHFFESTVKGAISNYSDADERAKNAADALAISISNLERCQKEQKEAEDALTQAERRKREAAALSAKSAAEAEDSRTESKLAKGRIAEWKDALQQVTRRATSATTVSETAMTEAKISEERAVDAEGRAKRYNDAGEADHTNAEAETKREVELEKEAANLQQLCKDASSETKATKLNVKKITEALTKIEKQIKSIESSHKYQLELQEFDKRHQQSSNGNGGSQEEVGEQMMKHRTKVQERDGQEQKLAAANEERKNAEKKKVKYQRALDEAAHKVKVQSKVASKARTKAEKSAAIADQASEYAEEEREAANMRHMASDRAEGNVKKLESQRSSITSQVEEAQQAFNKAEEFRMKCERIDKEHADAAFKTQDLSKYKTRLARKQQRTTKATRNHDAAVKEKKAADEVVAHTSGALNNNADIYHKAKVEAATLQHRANAERRREHNAASAFRSFKTLKQKSEEANKAAAAAKVLAAEKAAKVRSAKDYRAKKSKVKAIDMDLAELTTFHSAKFRYFEDSLTLPFNNLHSISEGKMLQLFANGDELDNDLWREFNKNHLTRIYPSRKQTLREKSNNFNPVTAWSLGCQISSMNQQLCDAFVLVNDGRFRVNGSCGYVLKPEFMIERKGGDISRRNRSSRNVPQRWNVKILSGYNLPKSKKKALTGSLNVRVRVTLYDGGLSAPSVHLTNTVKNNGLNPVWNEREGANFTVSEPSAAMLLFSLWDFGNGGEDFIAATAVPISCMREGYRSVVLFDSNHMRCGSHAYASLLVHIKSEYL